jgi:hypothetical protein
MVVLDMHNFQKTYSIPITPTILPEWRESNFSEADDLFETKGPLNLIFRARGGPERNPTAGQSQIFPCLVRPFSD